jgi:hypothetical protein
MPGDRTFVSPVSARPAGSGGAAQDERSYDGAWFLQEG